MANLQREGKNNQRRTMEYLVSDPAVITEPSTLFKIPKGSMVTAIKVITTKSEIGATLDIRIDGVLEADEVSIGNLNAVVHIAINKFYATGGLLTVEPGTTAPTTGEARILVEFVAIDATNGSYISF